MPRAAGLRVLRAGTVLAESPLMDHCRRWIAKCSRTIEFRDEPLPRSAMNKVLKAELPVPWWKDRSG
jgi:long-chain acyl-CoA synthetase